MGWRKVRQNNWRCDQQHACSPRQRRKHANTQTAQTRTKTLAKATWLEAKQQAKNGAKYRATEVTTGER